MTEFWKSNKNYWCEVCKVWMTDNTSTRATHEKGIKHQENVAKSAPCFRPQITLKQQHTHMLLSWSLLPNTHRCCSGAAA